MKSKSGFFEKLLQKNRVVFILSLLIAIGLWTTVKINYSGQSSRIISEVAINFDTTFDESSDYIPFFDAEDLLANVEVTGKGYNINSSSLTKDDIYVEASVGFVDNAGYKVLNLTAKTSESGVSVSKIEPSTITVFFDKKAKDTFNVEARLTNDREKLVKDGFVVGSPVPSLGTVDVSGPATIVQSLKRVYFEATISEDVLPLSATTEVDAEITYDLDNMKNSRYLKCDSIKNETNNATVTVPVSRVKTVPTAVKFINEPAAYAENQPKISISPSKVKISYSTQDNEEYDSFNVGTIDFSKLKNGINKFTFGVDEVSAVSLVDSSVKEFTVTINMNTMRSKTVEGLQDKVVLLNQSPNYKYSVDITKGGLDSITIIGPKSKIDKITAEDIQIGINVSSLSADADAGKLRSQTVKVSNLSIQPEEFNDCWIYGTYTAKVGISKK